MEKTITYIKEKRKAPEQVKETVKQYNKKKKLVLNTLWTGAKTIPQISEEAGMTLEDVTYTLMTLRKFNQIVTDEIDDMDEYFFYKLSKEE